MEVTIDELVLIIGTKEIEIGKLKREISDLKSNFTKEPDKVESREQTPETPVA